ncbi:MAG: hypothetical protein AAGB19_01165 [Cyanobacteria bacterium P01_F01_bin.3]
MTYSNNNNRSTQSRTKEANIGNWIKWLVFSEWSLERPLESFLRAAFIAFLLGLIVSFGKGADGTYCGRAVSGWRPDTWSSWLGCGLRALVRRVPDDFMEVDEFVPTQEGDSNSSESSDLVEEAE